MCSYAFEYVRHLPEFQIGLDVETRKINNENPTQQAPNASPWPRHGLHPHRIGLVVYPLSFWIIGDIVTSYF